MPPGSIQPEVLRKTLDRRVDERIADDTKKSSLAERVLATRISPPCKFLPSNVEARAYAEDVASEKRTALCVRRMTPKEQTLMFERCLELIT